MRLFSFENSVGYIKTAIWFAKYKFTSRFGKYVCGNVSMFSWEVNLYFYLKKKKKEKKKRLLAKTSPGLRSLCSGSLIYHGHIYTRRWKGQSDYVKLLACGIEAWSLVISDWFDFHFLFGGGAPDKCLDRRKTKKLLLSMTPFLPFWSHSESPPRSAWARWAAGCGLERMMEHCFINFTKLYFWAQNSCGFQLCLKMLHN